MNNFSTKSAQPIKPTKDPTFSKGSSGTIVDYRKPGMSYVQAANQKLLVSPSLQRLQRSASNMTDRSQSNETAQLVATKSPSHIRGASEFSVFYDLSGLSIYQPTFSKKMAEVIPKEKARGLKAHKDRNKTLVEFIVTDEETCQILIDNERPAGLSIFGTRAVLPLRKLREVQASC
ncbi:hypothetical protein K501DRAFT_275298 [Backusella circina FSU 941]|nr:hypothetical protein K501DRAFT_275298 [Backusella circina FSU 941]